MDRSERFYRIEQLLRDSAAPVPRATFLERLEVSLATFKHNLEYLRDRFGILTQKSRCWPRLPSKNGYARLWTGPLH